MDQNKNTEDFSEKAKRVKKLDELSEAAMPLIKYLNEKYDPHTIVIVTINSVELFRGSMYARISKFVKD